MFADEVGVARHLVVTQKGDVYVALENASRSSANSTHTSLSSMSFRGYSSINIPGLAIYLNLGDEEYADEVQQKCQRKGLLLVTQDEGLLLIPAVTVDRQVAARAMEILADCA